MSFQTHRPTQTLLIPQKRPLLAPVKPTINVVQHQHQHQTSPENSLPNTTTPTTTITPQKEERKEEEPQPTEYDFARIPQPFLDPRLWENIKSVESLYSSSLSASFSTAAFSGAEAEAASSSNRERRGMNEKEAEEEDRRKRAREAEYGGMAVRGRSGVRGRRDR